MQPAPIPCFSICICLLFHLVQVALSVMRTFNILPGIKICLPCWILMHHSKQMFRGLMLSFVPSCFAAFECCQNKLCRVRTICTLSARPALLLFFNNKLLLQEKINFLENIPPALRIFFENIPLKCSIPDPRSPKPKTRSPFPISRSLIPAEL
jgi:hypothetical protein